MSFHSDLFGWDYVWRHFADEKGGTAVEGSDGSSLGGLAIPVADIDSTLIFTPFVHHGKKKSKGTTVMASFQPASDFVFSIQTENWTVRVGKVFGMQDVQVQDAAFDSKFLMQGNDVVRIQEVFEDARLRDSLLLQPPSQLRIETNPAHFDPEWTVPAGCHALVYRYEQLVEKIDQLQTAYDIVTTTILQLAAVQVIRGMAASRSQYNTMLESVQPVQEKRLHSPLLDMA